MFLDRDGRNIHYDLVGPETGIPVLMVHSLLLDGGVWSAQVPPLVEHGFRILRVDIRGHGGSDAPAGDYSMDELADDVAAVAERLGLAQVHYAGVSIGAMIGQVLAARRWRGLLSAMICSSGLRTSDKGRATWSERIESVRAAGTVAPIAVPSVERWFSAGFKQTNPETCRIFRETAQGTALQGYLGCGAAIRDFNGVALEEVRVPTLAVRGTEDLAASSEDCREFAHRTRGEFVEVAGAAHLPCVEQPDAFNRIMVEWLVSRSA